MQGQAAQRRELNRQAHTNRLLFILQLGGKDKHSDWLRTVHYLRQESMVMELEPFKILLMRKLQNRNRAVYVTRPMASYHFPAVPKNTVKNGISGLIAYLFHPSREVNGENRTKGVGTDNSAKMEATGLYSITSRLRVSAKEWFSLNNRFTCTVRFFDGKEYLDTEDSIHGEKGNVTAWPN